MPIIINEFEVVTEPPPEPSSTQPPAQSGQVAGLIPEDIEHIMKYFRERQARLLAD